MPRRTIGQSTCMEGRGQEAVRLVGKRARGKEEMWNNL